MKNLTLVLLILTTLVFTSCRKATIRLDDKSFRIRYSDFESPYDLYYKEEGILRGYIPLQYSEDDHNIYLEVYDRGRWFVGQKLIPKDPFFIVVSKECFHKYYGMKSNRDCMLESKSLRDIEEIHGRRIRWKKLRLASCQKP